MHVHHGKSQAVCTQEVVGILNAYSSYRSLGIGYYVVMESNQCLLTFQPCRFGAYMLFFTMFSSDCRILWKEFSSKIVMFSFLVFWC